MSEKLYYRGTPVDEMSKDDLIAALIVLTDMQSATAERERAKEAAKLRVWAVEQALTYLALPHYTGVMSAEWVAEKLVEYVLSGLSS
jgi:hypothetical protein